jgi:hypothetical protein
MGLPEILFVGKGGNISIETQDTKNPVSDVYTAKLGKSDKNFKVIVKSELITRLLQEDYEVEIAGNKTAAIIQFTGTDVLYHVAPEATSTYP